MLPGHGAACRLRIPPGEELSRPLGPDFRRERALERHARSLADPIPDREALSRFEDQPVADFVESPRAALAQTACRIDPADGCTGRGDLDGRLDSFHFVALINGKPGRRTQPGRGRGVRVERAHLTGPRRIPGTGRLLPVR